MSADAIRDLAERYLATGDKGALARAISGVERATDDEAAAVAAWLGPRAEAGFVVGFTGAPGAGKSTLVDRLIAGLRERGSEVAVVAVDPTSPLTGGAILGDRVRMQRHSEDPGVYIRSVATRGHLGGLAIAVPRVVALLEGVGFPYVLVETVGVGQVELEITGEADLTVVVLNPGWGDAIQASKAGLMEVADVFVINKADRPGLRETRRESGRASMVAVDSSDQSSRRPEL
jgi:LAO/AO transport system kinase